MCAFTSRFVRTCKPHYNVTKFAGGCPAASHFLFLRQKKVTKEKATQVRRPFGLPCGTRPDRRLRNSPLRGSDSARRLPLSGLRSSADAHGDLQLPLPCTFLYPVRPELVEG